MTAVAVPGVLPIGQILGIVGIGMGISFTDFPGTVDKKAPYE